MILMQIITIIKKIAIITIMFAPPAREQIHKDPYLIVIDC